MSNLTDRETMLTETTCPWCGVDHDILLGTDFAECVAHPLEDHRCECQKCHNHFIVTSFVSYTTSRANVA